MHYRRRKNKIKTCFVNSYHYNSGLNPISYRYEYWFCRTFKWVRSRPLFWRRYGYILGTPCMGSHFWPSLCHIHDFNYCSCYVQNYNNNTEKIQYSDRKNSRLRIKIRNTKISFTNESICISRAKLACGVAKDYAEHRHGGWLTGSRDTMHNIPLNIDMH